MSGSATTSHSRALAAALLALMAPMAQALDLGALGKAAEAVQQASDAAATGQEVLETGRNAAEEARAWWQRNQQQPDPASAPGSSPGSAPASIPASPGARSTQQGDQGGPRRIMAVLDDAWADSARRGQAVVALMDQGPYFVQRQAAHVATAKAQWLATPRGDSTGVTLALPANPEGTTYDLATGKVRPGGRGVRIYALSVHTELPRRAHRRSLDAIEQHAMLRASSVRTQWPRAGAGQAPDLLEATGGKLLVWASDASQRFPAGFGADGRLFTADDPMVTLAPGYTVVTLDAQGLRFDRGREIALGFHPVLPAADLDLTRLSAGDAMQSLIGLIAERHPLARAAGFDAAALQRQYAPGMQAAADQGDTASQAQALAQIGHQLGDAQYRVWLPGGQPWPARSDRGLSPQRLARASITMPMPSTWLRDDGSIAITAVARGSAADLAGLRPGSQILSIEGESPMRYLDRIATASGRATPEARRAQMLALDQNTPATLQLGTRTPDGQQQRMELGAAAATTWPAPSAEPALASFMLRSARADSYAYIALDSFADGATGQLERWESSLAAATKARAAGLVIDLRPHRGDDAYQLLAHMLASLYTRDHPLRMQDATQRLYDPAARIWRSRGGLGLPAQLALAAPGPAFTAPVVALVDPGCAGPCELFAAWLQHSQRAQVMGISATAGATGQAMRVHLPGGFAVQLPLLAETGPAASARNRSNNQADNQADKQTVTQVPTSRGLMPDQRIAVDADFVRSVQAGGDPLLDAAVLALEQSASAARVRP